MDNETKLSQEQINSILNKAKDHPGGTAADSEAFFREHLSEAQAQKVKNILSDPQKLREIMESPLAKKIMDTLNKNNSKE